MPSLQQEDGSMSENLIEVRNLKKYFHVSEGELHAVDDVSFTIARGETLGLVGESGCGKSTIGRVLLRLIPHTEGQVFYDGENIFEYDDKKYADDFSRPVFLLKSAQDHRTDYCGAAYHQ